MVIKFYHSSILGKFHGTPLEEEVHPLLFFVIQVLNFVKCLYVFMVLCLCEGVH